MFGHIPRWGKLTAEGRDLMSVQETLLPCQFLTTSGCVYLSSQSTMQRNQEGCSGPGEGMDISPPFRSALSVGWKAFTERQCHEPNVHATWRYNISTQTGRLLSPGILYSQY